MNADSSEEKTEPALGSTIPLNHQGCLETTLEEGLLNRARGNPRFIVQQLCLCSLSPNPPPFPLKFTSSSPHLPLPFLSSTLPAFTAFLSLTLMPHPGNRGTSSLHPQPATAHLELSQLTCIQAEHQEPSLPSLPLCSGPHPLSCPHGLAPAPVVLLIPSFQGSHFS